MIIGAPACAALQFLDVDSCLVPMLLRGNPYGMHFPLFFPPALKAEQIVDIS